jgi:hypothetical protein
MTSQVIWESKICFSREPMKDPSRHIHALPASRVVVVASPSIFIVTIMNKLMLSLLSYYLFPNDVTTTVAAFFYFFFVFRHTTTICFFFLFWKTKRLFIRIIIKMLLP